MKTKTWKWLGMIALGVTLLFMTGCSANQKYADTINEKAKNGEHVLYEDVVKRLGEPTVKLSTSIGIIGESGACFWINGCKNLDEVNQRFDENKVVKGIMVTLVNGKATAATYSEFAKDDFKSE